MPARHVCLLLPVLVLMGLFACVLPMPAAEMPREAAVLKQLNDPDPLQRVAALAAIGENRYPDYIRSGMTRA